MNKTSVIIVTFLVGIAVGIAGTLLLPGYARQYMPESIMGKETTVMGVVVAKQRKGTSLLLTVNTPQGALLSTMKRKVDEIDLLVNVDDEIEFTLKEYKPFINDPKIKRVLKGEGGEIPVTPGKDEKPSVKEPSREPAASPEKKPEVNEKTEKEGNLPAPPAEKTAPQEKKTSL